MLFRSGRGDVAFVQFPGHERMLIARNAFGHGGFNLAQGVIAPYLWQEKIRRIDYLFLRNSYGQQTNRVQFMINTFHPQEVFSVPSTEMMIGGVKITGSKNGSVALSCRGWSFHFCDREVRIGKGDAGRGKGGKRYLITRDKMDRHAPAQVFSISQTGALTITVDLKGRVRMRGFLKKNLS